MQNTEYYPFGLATAKDGKTMAERNSINRFLYNEKELQVGSGYLDYGARMYMPEVGRWGAAVTKLAETKLIIYDKPRSR